jgi:hypothetical protein
MHPRQPRLARRRLPGGAGCARAPPPAAAPLCRRRRPPLTPVRRAGCKYGCPACGLEAEWVIAYGKFIYDRFREHLSAEHPLRSDPRFGAPATGVLAAWTDADVRARMAAYADDVRDAAVLQGVEGVSLFSALEYWDLRVGHVLDLMHLFLNLGAKSASPPPPYFAPF